MSDQPDSDSGVPGRSARREYERRRDRRQFQQPRSRLLRAFLGPSAKEKRQLAHDRQWATGARGEELLAESLAKRCPTVSMLHDRRLPTGRANIDHIAIAASGVYVIDTKRYHGKIEVVKRLFAAPKLTIGGRDRTKLIDALARQVAFVEAALGDVAPDIAVRGCLCFVAPRGLLADAGLPVLKTLQINGYPLYYPRRLAKRLNRPGPLTPDRAQMIQAVLASRLPPA
jgi:hypothetical protein